MPEPEIAIAIQVDRGRDAGPCRRAGAAQLQGPPAIQGEAGDERCTTLCDRRPRAALPSPRQRRQTRHRQRPSATQKTRRLGQRGN